MVTCMAQCPWKCCLICVIMILRKISEASSISNEALLARISLWDGIENEIKQRKKNYEKA